ncbi:cupin domain-containing protein [Peribacillus sp. SCS-26]|uniref:cupin domain-containing protein n=1 Tax=Paraperibacillus marinus TaxID=3115295 RepID=UPI003906298F
MERLEVQSFYFKDDGTIPNNELLPVILYSGACSGREDEIEKTFNKNNWLNSWRGGIFDYHHYHSNSHEVLGVIKGTATLKLGGEEGKELDVKEGDILVLPAGTGHKRIEASADFEVAGAYPDGMPYNTNTGKEGERNAALEDIKQVPLPDKDPVYGVDGPLLENWADKIQDHKEDTIDIKIR